MACLLGIFPLVRLRSAKKFSHSYFLVRPITIFGVILLGTSLCAQQPKVSAPHWPVPPRVANPVKWHDPAVLRATTGGLWMIDANFKSTIYLKNEVATDPITVTPILYLSNGHKYTLHDVTLEPAGVATININQALADQGIASWATLTGYVEIDYTWPWNALCVSVENVDVAHSLIFSSGLRASSPTINATTAQKQVVEGMWWKQESNVTGFVALSNTSPQAVQASIQVSESQGIAVAEHSVTVSPHGTKTVSLSELQQVSTTSGGIHVAYQGSENALIVNGALLDQSTGYSAAIRFSRQKSPSEKPTTATYAALGLMTGAADPMMSFSAGTTFAPYSVLRNVSDAAMMVTPTLWWMEQASARSSPLPQFQILPGSTQVLDVAALIALAGLRAFNGSVNLTFDVQGVPGGLLDGCRNCRSEKHVRIRSGAVDDPGEPSPIPFLLGYGERGRYNGDHLESGG